MVRIFDIFLWCFRHLSFLAILILGIVGYSYDTCNAAQWERVEWTGNPFELFQAGWLFVAENFRVLLDTGYKAILLFGMEYDRGCQKADPIPLTLEIARYLAIIFLVGWIVAFLVPRFRRWVLILLHVALGNIVAKRRAVVLGYGPLGQAVAGELIRQKRSAKPVGGTDGRRQHVWPFSRPWWREGQFVTAVEKDITPSMAARARRDNVVLVEGDPSDPAVLQRARIRWASCIVGALDSDMRTLDAIVAARAAFKGRQRDVRALVSAPDLAALLPEVTPHGFLGAPDIRVFSLASEAARLLVADARFDRVAVETGQKRVHVAILGCGAQGEAVAIETLLTGWREKLMPPLVSIFDKSIETVEMRFRRRAPALFLEGRDALPEAAQARVQFAQLDLEMIDFGSDAEIASLLAGSDAVTAWVVAAGDDTLNLCTAGLLHQAMLRGQIPFAPIHVRIWSGHQGDTPVISASPVSIAKAFGALENTVAESFACSADPDAAARELHKVYRETGEKISASDPTFRFSDSEWEQLEETKRNANRRLYRHAVMKFEDLGGQWRRPRRRAVPVVDKDLRDAYVRIEEVLDYTVHRDGVLAPKWWRDVVWDADNRRFVENIYQPAPIDAMRAQRLLSTAITEHNRWSVDRALDGWRKTPRPDARQRDERRRLHSNMHAWSSLDGVTRRWDAILLRTLVDSDADRDGNATAWEQRTHDLVLSLRGADAKSGSGVPVSNPRARWFFAETIPEGVTELRIVIAERNGGKWDGLVPIARDAFANLLLREKLLTRLCRIRFDFHGVPDIGGLAIANALGTIVTGAAGARWWHRQTPIWTVQRRLQDLPGVEVSAHWVDEPPPAYGLVGHRDLARLGGEEGLRDYLETFFARRLAAGRIGRLVSGYAPGADRVAVEAWLALGAGEPRLYVPYSNAVAGNPELGILPQKATRYFTGTLDASGLPAGPQDIVDAGALGAIAEVKVSGRDGMDAHAAQALDILENCQVLLAIYDGRGNNGAGGTGDTIEKARALGRKVIVINRDPEGAWRNDDPDDSENQPGITGD